MHKKGRGLKMLALSLFIVSILVALIFLCLVLFVYKGINFEADERLFEGSKGYGSTAFYADCDGVETAVETSGNIRKLYYQLEEISPYLTKGFVAVEDKMFYEHMGIDIKRTIMATVNYITKKDKIFGASTITQQVVKNISGDNQLSIKRKLEEIIRALHMERNYSKDEIMEVYLNVIPMSDNIYGVGAAAKAYFGKELNELSCEEAATLIGITNAPTAYNPYVNKDACLRKRNIVLSVMRDDGIISEEEYQDALKKSLTVIPREEREDRFDSWFVERVIDEVSNDLASEYEISPATARIILLGGGYHVYTTMNVEVQKTLEDYFENLSNFPEEVESGLNFAMVVTDSEEGRLRGIVGRVGKKSGNRLLNHATVPHIPGSTLKPIALYAPLIDEGKVNWATVFDDVPISFTERDGEYIEYPKNSPAVYDGLTTVKDGLRYSKNTLAVRLCNLRGTRKIFDSLRNDFGFEHLIEKEGSITDIAIAPMALGQLGRGVSLLKLTECYSVFSGEGELREASSYSRVIDHNGRVVLEKEQGKKRIFKPTTARIMNQILMTVTEDGTASKIKLKEKINTAGKTGTSGGCLDKTFIGYTPYYTAGIWCGYDSNKAIGVLSKNHLEIWDEIMTVLHQELDANKEFNVEDLVFLPYCKDSGKIYSEQCIYDPRGDRMEYGYFTVDNAPNGGCDRHIVCMYDTVTKGVATNHCPVGDLAPVSLIYVNDRCFPKEIIVKDAEFVCRDMNRYTEIPSDLNLPYFYYSIPEGVYVGKSKSKRQFNSGCNFHNR